MEAGDRGRFDDLSVVVPAYNEENGLGLVLRALQDRLSGAEIIAVDDSSSDRTPEIARQFSGVVVLQHVFNRGYGASLKSGMEAATREFVAWFDADNEHGVDDLVAMYDKLRNGRLAAVVAQRTSRSSTALRGIGKFGIRMVAHALGFSGASDLNCGLRVFRRELILPYLPILPDRYSASLTTTMLLGERGYPVAFHAVSAGRRVGKSKVVLADGFAALVKVFDLIMLFAPMRIFFRGGMLLTLSGSAYALARALISGEGIPVAGMLIVTTGVLSCLLGLIAKQVSELRLARLRPRGLVRRLTAPHSDPTGMVAAPDTLDPAGQRLLERAI